MIMIMRERIREFFQNLSFSSLREKFSFPLSRENFPIPFMNKGLYRRLGQLTAEINNIEFHYDELHDKARKWRGNEKYRVNIEEEKVQLLNSLQGMHEVINKKIIQLGHEIDRLIRMIRSWRLSDEIDYLGGLQYKLGEFANILEEHMEKINLHF